MKMILGAYALDIDVERTRAYYARPYERVCHCDGCDNFHLAIRLLGKDAAEAFKRLGVDPQKPVEMGIPSTTDPSEAMYIGFYHLCGTVETPKCPEWETTNPTSAQHASEFLGDTVEFGPNCQVSFRRECYVQDEAFPSPAFQMDVTMNLPWVLEKENPYADLPRLGPLPRLSDLPNIGAKLEAQLQSVGITHPGELRKVGAREAWLRILAVDSSACIHRLMALEGAIRGVPKANLPEDVKADLRAFLRSHKP